MLPLADFPAEARKGLRGVFTDIDDTLTTAGRLTAEAYAAMERLQSAGLWVIPITGRPAGWCDHIARLWPVDAVVGENGAFYFAYDRASNKMTRRFMLSAAERADARRKLSVLEKQILRRVPGSAAASDQAYRDADLAIDYCEDVAPLPASQVGEILAIMQAAGAQAKVSSIHVNGWFGDYDKLTMTRILMEEVFGVALDSEEAEFVFVGDSPNDEPMFRFFSNAVGVANVRAFTDQLEAPPRFVTERPGGGGFAELAASVIFVKSR